MYALKYQDYSQPWWFENMNNGISLQGKLFMSNSALTLTPLQGLYSPIVHAEPAADYGVAVGCGFQIARKDADDKPYFTLISEESIDLFDKLCADIFSDKASYLSTKSISGVSNVWTEKKVISREGRAFVETDGLLSNWQELQRKPLGWVDQIHFSRRSLYELGRRYYEQYEKT